MRNCAKSMKSFRIFALTEMSNIIYLFEDKFSFYFSPKVVKKKHKGVKALILTRSRQRF